jgi:hypothetical protein
MKTYPKNYFFAALLFIFMAGPALAQLPLMNPIQGPSAVCSMPSTPKTFTASATNSPTSYNWSVLGPPGVIIGSPSSAVTTISFPFPYVNTTYTIYCSATNGFGTSPTTSFVVSVFETPTVSFSGNFTFCQGSSTMLSASPTILSASSTLTYGWSPATGLNSTTTRTVIANPPAATNYTLLLTLGSCTNNAYATVTVNSLPVVSILATPSVICKGEKSTLSFSGSASSYSLNGNSTVTSVTVNPVSNTTYTLAGTDANGCINSSIALLKVNACVGMDYFGKTKHYLLEIYPNPNNGSFILRSGLSEKAVITDELGRTIKTFDLILNSEMKIDGLKPGVYYIFTASSKYKIMVTN